MPWPKITTHNRGAGAAPQARRPLLHVVSAKVTPAFAWEPGWAGASKMTSLPRLGWPRRSGVAAALQQRGAEFQNHEAGSSFPRGCSLSLWPAVSSFEMPAVSVLTVCSDEPFV